VPREFNPDGTQSRHIEITDPIEHAPMLDPFTLGDKVIKSSPHRVAVKLAGKFDVETVIALAGDVEQRKPPFRVLMRYKAMHTLTPVVNILSLPDNEIHCGSESTKSPSAPMQSKSTWRRREIPTNHKRSLSICPLCDLRYNT
jgi:hypothetical protein